MKKYISAFICGFGAGVLQIVPVAKTFACCLIIPAAAFIAIYLDQKSKGFPGKVLTSKGAIIGLITGLYAALFGSVFDLLITFITRDNELIVAFGELQKMVNSFPLSTEMKEQLIDMFGSVIQEIKDYGFSAIYTFSVIFGNLIVNSIAGLVGGLIGVQIFNSRQNNFKQN